MSKWNRERTKVDNAHSVNYKGSYLCHNSITNREDVTLNDVIVKVRKENTMTVEGKGIMSKNEDVRIR